METFSDYFIFFCYVYLIFKLSITHIEDAEERRENLIEKQKDKENLRKEILYRKSLKDPFFLKRNNPLNYYNRKKRKKKKW
jgi:hypothetical protein